MSQIAIVIGATGLVGRALVDELVELEEFSEIRTLTRRPFDHPSDKVFNYQVDFDNLTSRHDLFKGDMLFSCLGTTKKQAGSIAAQRKVDLDYQLTAAELAAEQGVKHYLLVSSSGANAHSGNPYLKMKGELEQAVCGLPFPQISIFQPSLLLGSRPEARLGEMIGSWVMPALCWLPGLRRYRPIKGEQVAHKMAKVSQQNGEAVRYFRLDQIFD